MPDTKSAGDEPEQAGSSGPKKMIATVLLAVLLIGVGYALGGTLGGAAPADDPAADGQDPAGADESEPEEQEHHVGVVVDLDAVNVNLAGGHYLRVAISLGLSEDVDFGHGSPDEFPVAAASDVLLETFSGRSMEELASPAGREAARHELEAGLQRHYGDDVVTVYYTEFVMQ